MSALLCEKVVQPTAGSYNADHLISGMEDASAEMHRVFGIKCSNLTTNRF
jgi:hypothetical protein